MTGSLLITGPPASGKSRAAMERFLAVPDSILLVPSATMAEHLRHELARAGTPIRPTRITTLAQFIEARSSSAAANAPLLHLLIREALSELQPVRFRAVADFAGFHQAIAALIDEAPASAVPEDLAAIFRSVERALETRGAALRSLRLIEAADHSSPLPQHVVFDGFFSFSPVEIVFLERLARRASLTVTLPAWPGAQAARRRLLDLNFGEMICSQRRREAQTLLVAAPTLDRETEEIARRILEETAGGRPFRDLGIVLRTRDPYAPALETTLTRFGIPARFYFADPLAAHPAVDYFSRIVDAFLNGWDHAALLAAVRMPVSRVGATPAGDAFDFALREKLPGAGLPLRDFENPPPIVATLTQISWRDRTDPKTWAARLKTLRELFPAQVIEDGLNHATLESIRSTSAAVDSFCKVLDETAALLDGRLALADFWTHVRAALSLETLRIPDRRRNVVHVMDVFEARQWELPVVFVCGMVERHFPQYHRENPLLGDAARRRAGLKTSTEWQDEESFLFDIATTRATAKNVLSFARFNEKGEESLRSFFLEGFLEGVEPDACDRRARPRAPRPVLAGTRPSIRQDASLGRLGELHRKLAATSIESFLQCPFQFFAAKTLRLRARPPAPRDRLDMRVQGSILHDALAEFARTPLLGSAVLLEIFEEKCRRANIPSGYRREAVRLELLRNFLAFTEDRQVALGWATRAEEKFNFALTPLVTITGRIDRLDVGPRNQALVIDYKYSAAAKIRDLVDDNESGNLVQGGLYLAAARRVFGLDPAGMLYCGLRKDVMWGGWHVAIPGLERIGESRTRDGLLELIAAAEAKASEVFESVASGKIAPRPADPRKCVWCDFRDVCRVEAAPRTRAAGEP